MRVFIVDSSVAIKWYLPEIHQEAALRLQNPDNCLQVPNLFRLEFGNVVCKKLRCEEISEAEADFIINELQLLPLEWYPDEPLFPKAYEIANQTARSLYDCLYLSMAMSLEGQMVTADLRFYDALKDSDYAERLLWIEDIP
jgi:predicted nucleic acid-binding protein